MQYLPGALETAGSTGEQQVWDYLVSNFNAESGTCGFKIPSVGVPSDDDIPSFVIITPNRGLVLIDVVDESISNDAGDGFWETNDHRQVHSSDIRVDDFYAQIEARLKVDETLFDRRQKTLRVNDTRLLVFIRNTATELIDLREKLSLINESSSRNDWQEAIADAMTARGTPLSPEYVDRIIARLDGTNALLPRRIRAKVDDPTTKGDFLELARTQIFKLDDEQRQVSLQLPGGPQRIRGLAGTGKTVILSLKAALTHKSNPNFRILYLFNTKSLYDIVRNHINKYFIPETKREPDWSRINVYHAWGGASLPGLYSELCRANGLKALTFDDIRSVSDQISHLYNHLLQNCSGRFEQTYDLVLIDEAQDFPPPVYQVIYQITKAPKRIVWAYDEFQTLSDIRMKDPEELFGIAPDGQPYISSEALTGYYSKTVKKDFVLPNSYRTSRVNLMLAHGLALGFKSRIGFIDMIDDRATWTALGYRVDSPATKIEFQPGDAMRITRPDEHSRNRLEETLRGLNRPDASLVNIAVHEDSEAEIAQVAREISELITKEGVKPEEIIAITLDVRKSRTKLTMLRKALSKAGVVSITPGIFERAEVFRQEGSVTLVTPFRAKGNESDVVFVLDAQEAMRDITFRARNFLFVSLTRARGWSYVSGSGRFMDNIAEEMRQILAQYPYFEFVFPDAKDIQRRRLMLRISDETQRAAQEQLEKIASENPELLQEFYRQRRELFAE